MPLHSLYGHRSPRGPVPASTPAPLWREPLKRVELDGTHGPWRTNVFGSLVGNTCIHVPRRRRSAAPPADKSADARWPSSSGSPEEVEGGAALGLALAAGSPFDERAIAGLLSLRTGSGMA